MSQRKYTHIQELEEEILSMRRKGTSRQAIADQLGLCRSQIKSWNNRYNRYNRKRAKLEVGISPRPKGRPRKSDMPRGIIA